VEEKGRGERGVRAWETWGADDGPDEAGKGTRTDREEFENPSTERDEEARETGREGVKIENCSGEWKCYYAERLAHLSAHCL